MLAHKLPWSHATGSTCPDQALPLSICSRPNTGVVLSGIPQLAPGPSSCGESEPSTAGQSQHPHPCGSLYSYGPLPSDSQVSGASRFSLDSYQMSWVILPREYQFIKCLQTVSQGPMCQRGLGMCLRLNVAGVCGVGRSSGYKMALKQNNVYRDSLPSPTTPNHVM